MIPSIAMATVGGAMIGLAASALLLTHGRIAGVSGIVGGVIRPRDAATSWRVVFVLGLLFGGGLLVGFAPETIAEPSSRSMAAVAVAGLFVGVGTRLGNGCTSGHGVCGLSRLSGRSMAATLSFIATGFLTATAVQLLFGGSL